MPKKIAISGIIANFELENESNVTPATLNKSLEDANGEDVLITINSPGGSVFAGLEMFSLIQNYSGKTETRIVSLAASMGSVLALAGDVKSAENTALYFIHNAQGIGFGDYRDLAHESEFLKDISILIANLYDEYTSLTLDEAREFMDEDSSFFGADLELLGFNIVNGSGEPSEPSARVNARMKFQEARAKMTDEKYSDDIEKAAASIDYKKFGIKNSVSPKTPAAAGKPKQEASNMSLKELLAANPDAQAEYDDGIKAAEQRGETAGIEKGMAKMQTTIDSAMPILASADYPQTVKDRVVAKMKVGDEEGLKDFVALHDMNSEAAKAAAALDEQDDETPPDTPGADADAKKNYDAKKKRLNNVGA
jgi:ATP-dependent protease ClpP protease subunit